MAGVLDGEDGRDIPNNKSAAHGGGIIAIMPRGIQVHITDPDLQSYLQGGPSPFPLRHTAKIARRATAAHITYRPAGDAVETIALSPSRTSLPAEELARAKTLMSRIGCNSKWQREHIDDFGWEVNIAPRTARNVLVIGCGCGLEMVFLRAVLPEAHFTAIDYKKCFLPGLEEIVGGITFLEGDINALLRKLNREYDLFYSNHTIEHLYDPDTTLGLIARLVIPGGTMVSCLPAISMEGTPCLDQVRKFMEKKEANPEQQIHPMDLVYFDPGHAWKTNPGDLVATLNRAGVSHVTIYQREDHWSRAYRGNRGKYLRERRRMVRLNRWIFAPLRGLIKLFPVSVGEKMYRYVYALERRLPFGTNRVINCFSEELLFVAKV